MAPRHTCMKVSDPSLHAPRLWAALPLLMRRVGLRRQSAPLLRYASIALRTTSRWKPDWRDRLTATKSAGPILHQKVDRQPVLFPTSDEPTPMVRTPHTLPL